MRGRLLLGLLSFLGALLLSEGLLSVLFPQVSRRPHVWQYDSTLGWRHVPGASGRMVAPEYDVEIAINQDGLRDHDYARDKVAGTWRILVFGDSFVEGWGVPLEASVAKQLERRLGELHPDRAVEVINFGVAGYGTDQELLLFEQSGRYWGADDVLVFYYANDLWNNGARSGIGTERGFKPYFQVGADGRLVLNGVPVPELPSWNQEWLDALPWPRRLERYLTRHWHLYVLARAALSRPEVDAGRQANYYEGLFAADPQGRWSFLWELSGRLLEAFRLRIEASGARMYLVYVPSIVQVDGAAWRRKLTELEPSDVLDLGLPGRRLAVLAERYGISFVDLGPRFQAAASEQTLYLRESHWNEAGHELAARLLADRLRPPEGRRD